MKRVSVIALLLVLAVRLPAVVGDWLHFGPRLSLNDLHMLEGKIHAASGGGLLSFDIQRSQFSENPLTSALENLNIRRYYVNGDGSQWFSYAGGVEGITCIPPGGETRFFDLGFRYVTAFAGDSSGVFAVYMNDFNPEVAHFTPYHGRYIFKDIYNRFPGEPSTIHDIAIAGDSLYLASDRGLYKASLFSANLKPAGAWTSLPPENNAVTTLFAAGDSLFYANAAGEICLYYRGGKEVLFTAEGEALAFFADRGNVYFSSDAAVYELPGGTVLYRDAGHALRGLCIRGDTLWASSEGGGLLRVMVGGGEARRFLPNSMLPLRANALAMTGDGRVAVCGIGGVSLLDGYDWHNLYFSPYRESLNAGNPGSAYSADTLNIAYRIGGQTAVYDAVVSSGRELIYTLTDVSALPVSGQSEEARGPGALVSIDLSDKEQYSVYDTSNGVIEGTQGLGGSSFYLKMRGLCEASDGDIWALNVHTLDAKPLIVFRTDGSVHKYSVDDADGKLQILPREMLFDRHGHLWIANEERQADIPRTTGGITVFDPLTNTWDLITTSDGLVSNNVYSLDTDPLTGSIWAATAAGVQMIRAPSSLLNNDNFNLNPPLDGLSGMVPVKIRIDPKGNKWILTQSQGIRIYLTNNTWFNEGRGLRAANSELPHDVVYDLVFDTVRGYAYMLTESGLSRYEIAWTEERTEMNTLVIFPQPFVPGEDPYLAIDGLAEQTQVVISTLDGRVVRQFFPDDAANKGKQIVWDGKLDNGKYISRGVYLVFAENIDGLRTRAKFAVK